MNRNLPLLALFLLAALPRVMAQISIHDGTVPSPASDPDASAMLDVQATNKGVLVPRVDIANLATAAPVTAPAEGLLVYNTNGTTGQGYYYWNAGSWVRLLSSTIGITGLAAPSTAIGLTAVNGSATTAMRSDGAPALSQAIVPTWTGTHTFNNGTYSALFTGGNVGIGNGAPDARLHVMEEGRFETDNGIIRVTPTGWRSASRAQLKIHSKGNQPAEIDMGHTDGGVEYGWHFSARGGGDNRNLQIYGRQDLSFTHFLTVKYADGNVGIGPSTANPTARLHVNGPIRFQSLTNGFLQADGNGNLSTASGSGLFNSGNGLTWSGTTLNSVWTANGSHIHNNNGGNVGINIATPGTTPSGHGQTSAPSVHVFNTAPMTGTGEVLRLERWSNGSDIVAASAGHIGMYLNDNNVGGGEVARISWQDGQPGNGDAEGTGELHFWTSETGSADAVPVQRMTINKFGNVGIGTTNPVGMLHIEGNSGSDVFRMRTSNGSGNATNIMRLTSANEAGLTGTQWDFAWLIETGGNPRDLWFKATTGSVRMRSDYMWLDQSLRVGDLAGTGTRNVVATSNGTLQTSNQGGIARAKTWGNTNYNSANDWRAVTNYTNTINVSPGDVIKFDASFLTRLVDGSGNDDFYWYIEFDGCASGNVLGTSSWYRPNESSNDHDNQKPVAFTNYWDCNCNGTLRFRLWVQNTGDDGWNIVNRVLIATVF